MLRGAKFYLVIAARTAKELRCASRLDIVRNSALLEFAGAARHAHHIEPAINPFDLHITYGHAHNLSSNRSDKEVSDMRSG